MLLMAGLTGELFRASAEETRVDERLRDMQTRLAADPTNVVLLMQIGDYCFDQGAKDDREAVELAVGYFQRVLVLTPTNALARVMLGSTLTMRGRDAFWPNVKLRYVREGLREMDAAVAQAPLDPRVRFERVVNNMHMPRFMDREEVVRQDFTWLWECARDPDKQLKTDLRQNIALFYGIYLKKRGDKEEACKIWTQGLQMAPGSKIGLEIDRYLKANKKPEDRVPPMERRGARLGMEIDRVG